ncbi:unnamed protein product [Lampetra planeri]
MQTRDLAECEPLALPLSERPDGSTHPWSASIIHHSPATRCSSRRCPTVPQVRADITARTCSSSLWQQQRQQQYEKPSQRQQCQ